MSGLKKLTNRQLAVIDDLFAGRLEEQEILDKYKLSRRLYDKWLNDNTFNGQFQKRINEAYRQSTVLIARYAPMAAAKLIQLTNSDKPETARKACLDIISMPVHTAVKKEKPSDTPKPADTPPPVSLNPETAGKLLAVLAEDQTTK
jgi:ABC-type proline/glycine betaine transport system substrate-binding protein